MNEYQKVLNILMSVIVSPVYFIVHICCAMYRLKGSIDLLNSISFS